MSCRTCDIGDKVPWSEFINNVMVYAKRVPPDVAEHFVRIAAIEFAQRTMTIKRDIYIDVQDCVGDYVVEVEDGYTIKSVKEVCLGGRKLESLLNAGCCDSGMSGYYFEMPCQILIGPTPSCDAREGLLVRATVAPGHDSCFIDRWVYDQYAEDIASGALSRILLMKDGGWYDQSAAGVQAKRWSASLTRAKLDRARAFSSAPVVMKAKRWV